MLSEETKDDIINALIDELKYHGTGVCIRGIDENGEHIGAVFYDLGCKCPFAGTKECVNTECEMNKEEKEVKIIWI